jgi:HK97 family phage prohead protease
VSYRGVYPLEFRSSDGEPPTLRGYFSTFNEWYEVESRSEGHFLERIAPGAFAKTFQEQRPKVLMEHGKHPVLGNDQIGSIKELREDEKGAFYEVSLFDGIPPLVMAGLRANGYGSSFRFNATRDDVDHQAKPSTYNSQGLPERTVLEARVFEFGPVTWPANESATASVRSLTDEFMAAPSSLGAAVKAITPHPEQERRVQVVPIRTRRFRNREEYLAWISKI